MQWIYRLLYSRVISIYNSGLLALIQPSFFRNAFLFSLYRVLPSHLCTLYVSFCGLYTRDITVLSQSSQVTHVRLLSLTNNQISWEVSEPFQALLEMVSGALQRLEIDNCPITDSTFSVVIPTLKHCSYLCVSSFCLQTHYNAYAHESSAALNSLDGVEARDLSCPCPLL